MLTLLVLILPSVDALVTFVTGRLCRLSPPELVTASNATLLGVATAPALAAAKGGRNLVVPGVLVGVFGYSLGTFISTLLFEYWARLF